MRVSHPPVPGEWLRQPALNIDLGRHNPALASIHADDPGRLSAWIHSEIRNAGCAWAWGGYGEDRALYERSPGFGTGAQLRSVHLGIDLWLPAGTPVFAMATGTVHSFADNAQPGDYGPTIILEHPNEDGSSWFCLYGHLARTSLPSLSCGCAIAAGQRIGWLGETHENGGWVPHLHLQLIKDMGSHQGDFPGVCEVAEADHWLANCPSPEPLLRQFGM